MSTLKDGFRNFTNSVGSYKGVFDGDSYVNDVEKAINNLEKNINELKKNGKSIDYLKGDVSEFWHGGSFNINAILRGDEDQVNVPRSNTLGSPDITSDWGDAFGIKYYKTGAKSAGQQAKSLWERYKEYLSDNRSGEPKSFKEYTKNMMNTDKDSPLYAGQLRIVPTDQLEEARRWLEHKIIEETNKRPEQVSRYEETLNLITDRIKNSKGTESLPLTEAEAKQIASDVKDDKFDPVEFGLMTEELVEWQYIMNQAYKAGLSAALISIVLEIAPELFKILQKMFREGEVNVEEFRSVGFAALRGSSLGLIRGNVASAITIACKTGRLGYLCKNVSPTIIGAVVVLTMSTLQDATLVAFGKMSKVEFVNERIQELFKTSCSLAVGSALQGMLPEFPVIAFMLGSFIGSVVGSFTYNTAYSCAISYYVETGCVFFGLVEQDYILPRSVLREIGLEVFEYEDFKLEDFILEDFELENFEIDSFDFETIDIKFLRRGVIYLNRIGYIT